MVLFRLLKRCVSIPLLVTGTLLLIRFLVYNIYEMNRPSPDDMKAMGVVDYVTELEMENKRLTDYSELLIETNERLKERNRELFDENKLLKKKLDILYHHV